MVQQMLCVLEKLRKAKFTHLTILKHQNTKTSLYKLSENHWVFALFEFFGFVRKRLQFTVFNDHPVVQNQAMDI